MRAADTNILVRLFTEDDRKQAEAARRFVKGGAWISHLVVAETIWVLQSVYGRTRDDIAKAVETLVSNESLVLQDPETVTAALDVFTKNKGVDFSDCLMVSIAQKAGHKPLGTLDKKLARLHGTTLIG